MAACECNWSALEDASQLLSGRCIIGHDAEREQPIRPGQLVSIRLLSPSWKWGLKAGKALLFKSANLLTEATALGLLHFFLHLHDIAIDYVHFHEVKDSAEFTNCVNLHLRDTLHNTILVTLFDAIGDYMRNTGRGGEYSRMRIHCRHLISDDFVPTAATIWEWSDHFRFRALCEVERPPEGPQLDAVLEELTRVRCGKSRQHIAHIWFDGNHDRSDGTNGRLSARGIDYVVRYFQVKAQDLRYCPKRITFVVNAHIGGSDAWPRTCPREMGVFVCRETNHPDRCYVDCGVFEYCLRNQPSGREFRVQFRPGSSNGILGAEEHIYVVHLVFN